MDKNNKIDMLDNILSKLKKGETLSDEELNNLIEMGMITESEKSKYLNNPSFKNILTERVQSELIKLTEDTEIQMMEIQKLSSQYNQSYEMIANMLMNMKNTKDSTIANLRSEPKYSLVDDDGYMMFNDIEYGEHTFTLYGDAGEFIATVNLRIENDASRPVSTRWEKEEDGTWVFNVGGSAAIAMFDLNLNEADDGTKAIEFSEGMIIEMPPKQPMGWMIILIVAAGLAAAAAGVVIFKKRKSTKLINSGESEG